MTIGKVCKSDVTTISEKASIQEAAAIMGEKNIGCLLVIKDESEAQEPIGIITDRDITIKIVAKKTDLNGLTVAEAMSKDLLMLQSDQGIKKSIEAMHSKGVRRAPVVENNKVCGIVAVDDLIMMIASELSDLADLFKRQIDTKI